MKNSTKNKRLTGMNGSYFKDSIWFNICTPTWISGYIDIERGWDG